MDELRFVRREDQSLIVANVSGTEYKVAIDLALLSEIKQYNRRDREAPRVSPRDIQRMLRAGKSQTEIIEATAATDEDIARYGEPVFAERRFMLSSAQSVSVRTSPAEGSEQQFGEVMQERLAGLQAEVIEWSTWKDDETGWMIGLEFISHDVAHNAVWQFDHRKAQLTPTTPDAVSLSRQGDLGDRLIPKLRAVESEPQQKRFEVPFDPDALTVGLQATAEVTHLAPNAISTEVAAGAPETLSQVTTAPEVNKSSASSPHDTQPVLDPHAEFLRRREIDQRSMSTPPSEVPDLSQTADLLDALRQRRTARESVSSHSNEITPELREVEPRALFPSESTPENADLNADMETGTPATEEDVQDQQPRDALGSARVDSENGAFEKTKKHRGRASIPSWDDILFGTRSEENPV